MIVDEIFPQEQVHDLTITWTIIEEEQLIKVATWGLKSRVRN